jgi:hypothetical protein
MKTTYLASPIGSRSIEEANQWRNYVQEYFYNKRITIDIRSPLRGKIEEERKNYTDAEIVIRDKNDIRQSDFIIVYWSEREISNGTCMEILEAWNHNVPVIFIGEWAKEDKWLRYHVTRFFDNLDEALNYIEKMWL